MIRALLAALHDAHTTRAYQRQLRALARTHDRLTRLAPKKDDR